MKESTPPQNWNKYKHLSERLEISAKTVLLREGEVAKYTYYIEKGCIRIWFNDNGKDVTLNFFFEGEGVSSIESFRTNTPSAFYLESLEQCTIYRISKKDFQFIMSDSPAYKERIEEETFRTLFQYQRLFLSRIKNNPEERYQELITAHPEILLRIPQHYIASYLGITPVSLSRIRNKR